MLMLWRKITWFVSSLGIGTVAARTELRRHPWLGSVHLVALPFVISQFCAIFLLRRMWRADGLATRSLTRLKDYPEALK